MKSRWKLLSLALVLTGCAGRGQVNVQSSAEAKASLAEEPHDESSTRELDASLAALPGAPAEPTVQAPAAADNLGANPYAGTIARTRLLPVVDQGLGRFLSHLRLSPVFEGARFVGFAIAGIDPAWGDIGLVPGDVLVRVNGQPIERPEQAQAAFESLRVVSEVVVDITRAGVPATLRYRIE